MGAGACADVQIAVAGQGAIGLGHILHIFDLTGLKVAADAIPALQAIFLGSGFLDSIPLAVAMDMDHSLFHSFQGHIAGQHNPAGLNTAPGNGAIIQEFQDLYPISPLQLTHRSIGGVGTCADVQITIAGQSGVSLGDHFGQALGFFAFIMVTILAIPTILAVLAQHSLGVYIPIAQAMAGGRNDFIDIVIAVLALAAALAVLGAGCCRMDKGIAISMTGGRDHLELRPVTQQAMPAGFALIGAGRIGVVVPLAHFVAGGRDHFRFLVIAMDTVADLIAIGDAGCVHHDGPVIHFMAQGVQSLGLHIAATQTGAGPLANLGTGRRNSHGPLVIIMAQGGNFLCFKMIAIRAIPALLAHFGTGGILGHIPIGKQVLQCRDLLDFKVIAQRAILAFFTGHEQIGCYGLVPLAHFVITEFAFAGLKLVAVQAILALQVLGYAVAFLSHIPIGVAVAGDFCEMLLKSITQLTIPAFLARGHTGSIFCGVPVAINMGCQIGFPGLIIVTVQAISALLSLRKAGGVKHGVPIAVAVVPVLLQLVMVKVRVFQADPAYGVSAPNLAVDDLHRQDLHLVTLDQLIQPTVIGAGALTDIQIGIGDRNHHTVVQFLAVMDQQAVVDHDPAHAFHPAVPGEVHLIHFHKQHFIPLLQRSQLGIAGVGAIVDRNRCGAEHRCIQRCFIEHLVLAAGRAATARIRCLTAVVGVFQAEPALFELAPQAAVGDGQLCDGHLIAPHHGAYHRVGGIGALTHIDHIAGHGSQHSIANIVAAAIILTAALCPVGIQGHLVHVLIQVCNLNAANLSGIPAQEGVAFTGGRNHGGGIEIAVIALCQTGQLAAAGIIHHIAVVIPGINAVVIIEVHFHFRQTTAHQAFNKATACRTPLGHHANQRIAGVAVDNGVQQLAILIKPAGAAVIADGQHGIELTLGKGQIIPIDEQIDILFKASQMIPEQGLSLVQRYTLCQITIQLVIRASVAVTHRPLAVVPERNCRKAFHGLQIGNDLVAGFHIGGCMGMDLRSRDQTHQHRNR